MTDCNIQIDKLCKMCALGEPLFAPCNTTFRFDNPNAEEVECAKRLVALRKNNIQRKTDT